MNIKILGMGCKYCKELYDVTKETIEELEVEAEIEKIEDMKEIMKYGVMRTPALLINEKVVMQGKIPKKEELKEVLRKAL